MSKSRLDFTVNAEHANNVTFIPVSVQGFDTQDMSPGMKKKADELNRRFFSNFFFDDMNITIKTADGVIKTNKNETIVIKEPVSQEKEQESDKASPKP